MKEEMVSKVEVKNILSFSIFCGYKGCDKKAIKIDVDEINGEVTVYCVRHNEIMVSERKILSKGLLKRLIYSLRHGHIGDVHVDFLSHTFPFRKGLPDFCLECGCAYCEKHFGDRTTYEKSHCIYTEYVCCNGHKYKDEYKSR